MTSNRFLHKSVVLLSFAVFGCGVVQTTTITRIAHTPAFENTSSCKARDGGLLPDPHCTPGVADPKVTQANIGRTICVPGYSKSIRPSVSYTEPLKKLQIHYYHYADTNPRDYEEDHLMSLELGGSPTSTKNLWPESHSSSFAKDKIENSLHRAICSDKISLAQAQHEISSNWTMIKKGSS